MSTGRNPYFALLTRMDAELDAVRPHLESVPAWMDDLAVFARALALAARETPEKQSLTQSLKKGAQDLYSDLREDIDRQAAARDLKAQSLVKDVQASLDALGRIVSFTMSNDAAFGAVKEAMPSEDNKNSAQAPVNLAFLAAQALNAKLDPNPIPDSPTYALISGPLNFFTRRLINLAACQIQSLWEGKVLALARGAAPSQLQQNLFAVQGGLVRDFAANTLEHILNQTLSGYEPENLFGLAVPFTTEFLAFLNSGLSGYQPVSDEYGVTITALPIDVNEGAAETPYAVELSLHCAREKQGFVNYNSPASALFTWRRDTCGDTGLAIRFRSITLNIPYAGENGFLDFLNDFHYGEKTFQASDFPAQQAALDKLGVRDITLQYQFAGADELLNSHRVMAGNPPAVAAVCPQ
jgi:type VI secretion system protein ImpL